MQIYWMNKFIWCFYGEVVLLFQKMKWNLLKLILKMSWLKINIFCQILNLSQVQNLCFLNNKDIIGYGKRSFDRMFYRYNSVFKDIFLGDFKWIWKVFVWIVVCYLRLQRQFLCVFFVNLFVLLSIKIEDNLIVF